MAEPAFNPSLIRVVLIVLVLLASQIVRAMKASKPAKPEVRTAEGKSSGRDLLRELKRQAAEQSLARQNQLPRSEERVVEPSPFLPGDRLQQTPTIQPESSFIPSLLLVSLLVCLGIMAYRYFAG